MIKSLVAGVVAITAAIPVFANDDAWFNANDDAWLNHLRSVESEFSAIMNPPPPEVYCVKYTTILRWVPGYHDKANDRWVQSEHQPVRYTKVIPCPPE